PRLLAVGVLLLRLTVGVLLLGLAVRVGWAVTRLLAVGVLLLRLAVRVLLWGLGVRVGLAVSRLLAVGVLLLRLAVRILLAVPRLLTIGILLLGLPVRVVRRVALPERGRRLRRLSLLPCRVRGTALLAELRLGERPAGTLISARLWGTAAGVGRLVGQGRPPPSSSVYSASLATPSSEVDSPFRSGSGPACSCACSSPWPEPGDSSSTTATLMLSCPPCASACRVNATALSPTLPSGRGNRSVSSLKYRDRPSLHTTTCPPPRSTRSRFGFNVGASAPNQASSAFAYGFLYRSSAGSTPWYS